MRPDADAAARAVVARTRRPPQRGGTEPGASPTANAAANPDAVRRFELLDLTTGVKVPVPNAGGFQFSKGSEWLAIKMTGAPNDTSHRGTDLLLRRLSTGTTQNIGNVNQYDFDDPGKLLAYTVDATNRLGNGVYVPVPIPADAVPDGAAKDYDGLTWATDSTRLAVLRGEKPKARSRRTTRSSRGPTPAPHSRRRSSGIRRRTPRSRKASC